jgi:hypothetical protein
VPLSQVSLHPELLMMLSPQIGGVQSLRQESLSLALPSSQISPSLTMPSPQKVQAAGCPQGPGRHAPWLAGAPAGKVLVSQVSLQPDSLIKPSPQIGKVQSLWQPSVSTLLASSHASPSLTIPSPQKVQAAGCPQGPGRHAPWLEGAPAGKALVSQVSLHPRRVD